MSQKNAGPPTIVLACGGSGGHIFPAVAVAEELKIKSPQARLFYVCGKKDLERAILGDWDGENIFPIESAPFAGGLSLLKSPFLIKSTAGLVQSLKFLSREKPDLVAGFGGYASFPVLLAARLLGQKTLLHEQNVIPGTANRLLARAGPSVAVSFPETAAYLPRGIRLCVTGNPIREFIEKDCRREALGFFGFSEEKKTVLALGGSQGADSINTFFLEALGILPERLRQSIQVLHLCGRMPPADSEARCRSLGVSAKAYSFFKRMDLTYGAADLAVGRAGATFLAEIKAKKIPAVLVPYPYGSGHQRMNAEVFCRSGESLMIEQKDLTAEGLAAALEKFINRAGSPKEKNSSGENPREKLADLMIGIARRAK